MKKFIYGFVFLFISMNPFYANDEQRDYFEQISFIETLGSKFTNEIIGEVSYDGVELPVYKITYNPLSKNKTKYLVICGVHGNEPAPVYAISSFLQQLNQQEMSLNSPRIDFIYIVNPWGFIYDQRQNGIHIDINRDITTQVSQEAKIFQKSISIKEYTRVFDFHEGNTKGYYLYYYSKNQTKLVTKIVDLYKSNKLPLENEYIDVVLKAQNGVIFVPWYAKIYTNAKRNVTTTLWASNNGIDGAFTIESSKNRPMEERKNIIIGILQEIVNGNF